MGKDIVVGWGTRPSKAAQTATGPREGAPIQKRIFQQGWRETSIRTTEHLFKK